MSGIWKTKDGTEIKICDMTDNHLKNTIRMIENKYIEYELEQEELLSSERDITPPHYPDVYFELKSELEKRVNKEEL